MLVVPVLQLRVDLIIPCTRFTTRHSSLPTCLRVLLTNERMANLPVQVHTAHCRTLIALLQVVLNLFPWQRPPTNGSLEATNFNKTSSVDAASASAAMHLDVMWPVESFAVTSSSSDDAQHRNITNTMVRPSSATFSQRLLRMWIGAFTRLPPLMADEEPIFQSGCLTAHWTVPGTGSAVVSEQCALLLRIMHLSLRPPGRPRNALRSRMDLHTTWYKFIADSFFCWGTSTPRLTRTMISQVCANLLRLAEVTPTTM